MATLFDKSTQDEMLARVGKLSPTSHRQWGKMSVSQMLEHMSRAFAVPINKIQVPKDTLYYVSANPFFRWLMIRAITKWPKSMLPAPQSFKVRDDPDFELTKKDFLQNYNDFLNASDFSGRHPVFGVMKKELWGEAMNIHLNHHLEQFGV